MFERVNDGGSPPLVFSGDELATFIVERCHIATIHPLNVKRQWSGGRIDVFKVTASGKPWEVTSNMGSADNAYTRPVPRQLDLLSCAVSSHRRVAKKKLRKPLAETW